MTDENVELATCDGCGEETPSDDLRLHEDGNWYCEECDYLTEQDRLDAAADALLSTTGGIVPNGLSTEKEDRIRWLAVEHIKKAERDRLTPWLYHAPGCATNCHEPDCTTPHQCDCGLDAALDR